MSYTNVKIPDLPSNFLLKKLHDLEAEKDYWVGQVEQFHNELKNIPEAVEEYGHVDLYDEKGNLIMTLVKKEKSNAESIHVHGWVNVTTKTAL